MPVEIEIPASGSAPAYTMRFMDWQQADEWLAAQDCGDGGVSQAEHENQERHGWEQAR
jgi:hypothetical protein